MEKSFERRYHNRDKYRHRSSSSSSSTSRSRSREKRSRKKSRNHRKQSRRSRSSCHLSRGYPRSPSFNRRTRYYGTRENPYETRVIGIFGLHSDTNESKLMDIFSPFGAIEHVSIIHDAKTGNSRGFGFIYYSKIEEATLARTSCNGMTLDGKRVRVDYSITKRAHTPTPGIYMGAEKSHEKKFRRCHRRHSRSPSRHRRRSHRRDHSRTSSRSSRSR